MRHQLDGLVMVGNLANQAKKTSKLQKTKPLSLVFTNLRAIQKVKRIECKPNARWTPHSWLRQ